MRHLWPGVPLALGSATLFGASTPFAKTLLGQVSPWMLAGLLYLASGVGLFGLHLLRHATAHRLIEAPLRRADWPWLIAVIASGGILGPVLLLIGLRTSPASSASLLLNLEGVFTLTMAWVVFRENVDLRIGLGAAAILCGALPLSWTGSRSGLGWGGLAIAGACFAWALDNNLTRKLSGADPVQIAMIKGLAAGSVNVALSFAVQSSWPAPRAIAGAAVVGFFGYGVSLTLFVLALRHLGTARTGAYFSAAPFVGAVIALFGFGEPVNVTLLIGAVLMGIGVYLHLTERHEHAHRHEPTVHEHRHVHDLHHEHEHAPDHPPGEPHTHIHAHARLVHRHPHYPDTHHRHRH